MRAAVGNAADRQQVERAQRHDRERERRYRASLEAFANTTDGLAVLEHWMERCRVFAPVFSSDTNEMIYETGRRDVGLELLTDFTLARPDALAVIIQQRATEERANA